MELTFEQIIADSLTDCTERRKEMRGERIIGNAPTFKFDKKRGIVHAVSQTNGVKYFALASCCDEYLQSIVEFLNIGFDEWFNEKCMKAIEEWRRTALFAAGAMENPETGKPKRLQTR